MRYDSKSLGRKFVIDIVGYRPERRQATMFVTYAVQNRMDASRFTIFKMASGLDLG